MSKVLVDTSVWVEMFRNRASPETEALKGLLQGRLACVNGLIRAEVLSGARSDKDFRRLARGLSALELLADPDNLWDRVANSRYRLARGGFQASVADLVVAVCACHHRKALFSLDRAFGRIQGVLPLRLFEPTRH